MIHICDNFFEHPYDVRNIALKQKYLINEDGKLAKVISPRTQPVDPTILSWIEN